MIVHTMKNCLWFFPQIQITALTQKIISIPFFFSFINLFLSLLFLFELKSQH